MALAAVGWGTRDLATKAKVSLDTIARFKRGERIKDRTLDAIRAALEAAGVEFIGENGGGAGVRLKKEPTSMALVTRFSAGQIWANGADSMLVIHVDDDPHFGALLARGGNVERFNVAALQAPGVWTLAAPDRFHLLDLDGHLVESAPYRDAFEAISAFGNKISRETNSAIRLTFKDAGNPRYLLAYLHSRDDGPRGLWPVYQEGRP